MEVESHGGQKALYGPTSKDDRIPSHTPSVDTLPASLTAALNSPGFQSRGLIHNVQQILTNQPTNLEYLLVNELELRIASRVWQIIKPINVASACPLPLCSCEFTDTTTRFSQRQWRFLLSLPLRLPCSHAWSVSANSITPVPVPQPKPMPLPKPLLKPVPTAHEQLASVAQFLPPFSAGRRSVCVTMNILKLCFKF